MANQNLFQVLKFFKLVPNNLPKLGDFLIQKINQNKLDEVVHYLENSNQLKNSWSLDQKHHLNLSKTNEKNLKEFIRLQVLKTTTVHETYYIQKALVKLRYTMALVVAIFMVGSLVSNHQLPERQVSKELQSLGYIEKVKVCGQIIDAQTHQPIKGATFHVNGLENAIAITEKDGSFSLKIDKRKNPIVIVTIAKAGYTIIKDFEYKINFEEDICNTKIQLMKEQQELVPQDETDETNEETNNTTNLTTIVRPSVDFEPQVLPLAIQIIALSRPLSDNMKERIRLSLEREDLYLKEHFDGQLYKYRIHGDFHTEEELIVEKRKIRESLNHIDILDKEFVIKNIKNEPSAFTRGYKLQVGAHIEPLTQREIRKLEHQFNGLQINLEQRVGSVYKHKYVSQMFFNYQEINTLKRQLAAHGDLFIVTYEQQDDGFWALVQ